MGCNTSKDSSVPQENDKQENEDGNVKNTEDNKKEETSSAKSPSAKTITLRSDGSPTSPEERNKESTDASKDEKEESAAATKIQAVFRGHQTRKSMKQPAGKVETSTASSEEPTREELEQEFRLDDKELCDAATKIQASFRGHMTRKQEADKKNDSGSSQENNVENEEVDIDLSDPELNKAAVKIQASFRGHMVRKENEGEPDKE